MGGVVCLFTCSLSLVTMVTFSTRHSHFRSLCDYYYTADWRFIVPAMGEWLLLYCWLMFYCSRNRGAADAEIKVPSGENTELIRSPFKAWSRSVYSHTCYAYCQGFLPCLFLHFRSIHLHFPRTSPDFSCSVWLTHSSCVGLQYKIGHPAGCRFPYWVPVEYK